MKKYNQKILLATGGTGGHIFPALALKATLEKHGFNVKVTADSKFSKFHPFDSDHIFIPSANFSNKKLSALCSSLFTIAKGLLKSLWLIYKYKPDIVIGFGGYASFPTMLAAIKFNKEIILHEANTVIGKVNKILLCRARYITTGFKEIHGIQEKYRDKIIYTGNPIRTEILTASSKKSTASKDKLSILIIGGSQGAKIFSKLIPDAIINLPKTLKDKLYIYQQAKTEDIAPIQKKYAKEGIDCEIKAFFSDMNKKFSNSNLVIARAGASTISELIAFNLPAIFIPYPSAADNHQYYNAKAIMDIGGAWIVDETPNSHVQLLKIIKSIDKDHAILNKYSTALKPLHQNASENIVQIVKQMI